IGEIDEKQFSDSVAEGMINGLGDEWSYYIPEESYASYVESAENAYVGIGVTITIEGIDEGLLITDVTPDSPAFFAGIEIGDVMVAVEGVPIRNGEEGCLDLTETKNRVRGTEGTDVTITILRDGSRKDYTITRARIKVVNVTFEMLDHDIGYIRIRNFDDNAAEDAINAINDLVDQGAKSLVFDVRFNPGGYKRELVQLLDYILPEGPLFRSLDYAGREHVDYSDAAHIELPIAVLVNYDSYSAAEFFAAALQEYDYAVIVGEQTYGKGRFQSCFQLSDGSAVNLSIGEYTTPNGVSLVGKGITPDHLVELTEEQRMDLYYNRLPREDDAQFQKAISVLTP
ncbi:MAG: S41 family peptidase, partial [Clostridia bacterium]|nr:S41 family peptidase [Clostridia bacterium]